MKREISFGEVLAMAVTILITIAASWMNISNRVAQQQIRIENLESNYNKIELKQDNTIELLKNIEIKLENKIDRKNQ